MASKKMIKLNEVGTDVSKQDLNKTRFSALAPPPPLASNTSRKELITGQLLQSLLSCTARIFIAKNSFAKIQFRNSNSYFGWLNSNGFNGFGTYTFKTGASFKGTFEESLSKGLGSLTYINGDIYEGEFLAGLPHGYGYYKSERFKYRGYFKNGKFNGKGCLKTRTEEIEGIFYVGRIKSGEARDCSGVFNGKRHGLGMLSFNQRLIICQWSCGKKRGAGIIIACNGSCYSSTELFIDDQYKDSQCIRNCQESQMLLSEAINILNLDSKNESLDIKMNTFKNIVKILVEQYSILLSPINPIRIPNYEIPPGFLPSSLETKHLQQVLVENYTTFKDLYKKYTHPSDECLNYLGLNLFYMDVFHKVRDINLAKCMRAGHFAIRQSRIYWDHTNCNNHMAVVPFYEFFQHFVYITEVLMENEALKLTANEMKPSFFGHLATRVILVLRMLETNETSLFLVREGICGNLPKFLNLLHLLEEMFLGEKSIVTVYKFLKIKNIIEGRSTEFFETIERFYDVSNASGVLFDNQHELSNLEVIEIILRICQFKLTKNIL